VQLAAQRLAPVQLASWGHPSTTGLPTIDLFLSAAGMEPDGADAHYTERLVRLPGLSSPVTPSAPAGPIPPRADLGLAEAAIVFWCGQPLHKYLPQHDRLLVEIARRVPAAVFVFVAFAREKPLLPRFRARLEAAFRASGLDPAPHLLVVPEAPAPIHRARVGCADVLLDSPGWSGCNSMLDALVHGVPVVTWPGNTMRSRHGAALLSVLGVPELIADSAQAYVALAERRAGAPAERKRIGARLRAGLGRLADRSAIPALETCLWSACSAQTQQRG
jgi:protein O-GlcNAc transferase